MHFLSWCIDDGYNIECIFSTRLHNCSESFTTMNWKQLKMFGAMYDVCSGWPEICMFGGHSTQLYIWAAGPSDLVWALVKIGFHSNIQIIMSCNFNENQHICKQIHTAFILKMLVSCQCKIISAGFQNGLFRFILDNAIWHYHACSNEIETTDDDQRSQ